MPTKEPKPKQDIIQPTLPIEISKSSVKYIDKKGITIVPARLIKVINAISGGSSAVKMHLISMLKPKDALSSEEPSMGEANTPNMVDRRMGQFKDEFAKKMQGKSAVVQMDLVTGLVADLDLKGNEATFLQKLRKVLSKKK